MELEFDQDGSSGGFACGPESAERPQTTTHPDRAPNSWRCGKDGMAVRKIGCPMRVCLHQLRVQFDLGVVGEELGDGAAGLGVGGGLIKGLLGSTGTLGRGGQSDL